MYAHLSNYTVKKGDKVKAGQQIGVMGGTGYSTSRPKYAPYYWPRHLHVSYFPADLSKQEINPTWLIKDKNWKNKVKNPLDLIKEKGNSYPANMGVSGQFNSDDDAYTVHRYYHEGIDFGRGFLPNWQFGIAGEIITNGAVSNYPMKAPFTNVDHADFPLKKSEEDK